MQSARPNSHIVALVGIRLIVSSLFVLAFLLSTWIAKAATITVTETCTLIDAIDSANHDAPFAGCPAGSGDDIIVLTAPVTSIPWTYNADGPNATGSITGTIVISGGVAGAVVKRTGAETGHLTLVNVSVRNGRVSANDGGAIYNRGTLTLINSVLISNTAPNGYGGGFYNYLNSITTLTGSDLIANTANFGGGGFHNNGGTTLTDSDLISNTAQNGGGFSNNGFEGRATLTDVGIRANQATNNGGGFYNSSDAKATLTGGELLVNTANKGGGFYNNGTVTLSQAYIFENVAANSGGALYHEASTASTTLEQSCIVNNSDVAVVNINGPAIEAENNWWGASDGPSGKGLGSGDSVLGSIDFTPFLSTAIFGCPPRQAEIAFRKRVSPTGNLMPGQPLTYTLTNTGNITVHNLYVADVLPPLGFVFDSLCCWYTLSHQWQHRNLHLHRARAGGDGDPRRSC